MLIVGHNPQQVYVGPLRETPPLTALGALELVETIKTFHSDAVSEVDAATFLPIFGIFAPHAQH